MGLPNTNKRKWKEADGNCNFSLLMFQLPTYTVFLYFWVTYLSENDIYIHNSPSFDGTSIGPQ
jgi:hypothetical protein